MNAHITDIITNDGPIKMTARLPSEYLYSTNPLKKVYHFAGCISPRQAVGLQYVTVNAKAYRQIHQKTRRVIKLNLGVNASQEPYKLAGAVNDRGDFFLVCVEASENVADIQAFVPLRVTSLSHMINRLHSRRSA